MALKPRWINNANAHAKPANSTRITARGANITTPTEFVGDKNLLIENTPDTGKIIALYRDGKAVDT